MLQVQHRPLKLPGLIIARLLAFMPRWGRWSIAAVALVMPVLAFTHGHAFKQAVKAAWSRWDVRRAVPLLQNELTAQEGVHLLLRALMRSPNEPEVIRTMAQLTDQAGMPFHSRFFYEHLARRNAATAEDKLRHAATLARLHDQTGAQIALRKFAQDEGESPALWRTQAEIAASSGDFASARAALSKVLAQVPQDAAATLDHAKSTAFSPEADQQRAGIEQLLDLFEKSMRDYDSTQRTHCFWTLSGMTLHDTAQRDRFAALIDRMPWKKLERRVMQRLLQASLNPSESEKDRLRDWLREMFVREADTEAEERLSIAKMLQRHGLHLLVLEWITFDLGLKDTALCTTRLDSLIATQLWTEAVAMVNHPGTPLPRPLQAIMQAHLELLTTGGKTLKSGELLQEALTAARERGNQGAFVAIAHMAAQFGHHDIALMAYTEAMDPRFPVALFLAGPFIQEARRAGGSANIVLQQLTRRMQDEAWNQDLLRQVRYYQVLCGERLEVVEAEAAQRCREQPQDVYSAFLVAFARLRLGQTADLKSCLPLLSQPHAWTEGERAALHAIFHAAADDDAADSFKQGIAPDAALYPEERRLLAAEKEGDRTFKAAQKEH
ncbi:MAG: hypothetical protein ACKVY0_27005 [Prosthecobacter sp.]|uniref:hypothetical protein n=1 Tax=Prosthecobacter sp. TaxID=1965333 RepID=UPI0039040BB0